MAKCDEWHECQPNLPTLLLIIEALPLEAVCDKMSLAHQIPLYEHSEWDLHPEHLSRYVTYTTHCTMAHSKQRICIHKEVRTQSTKSTRHVIIPYHIFSCGCVCEQGCRISEVFNEPLAVSDGPKESFQVLFGPWCLEF